MDRPVHHLDATEMCPLEISQEFVVITGNVDDIGALAALAKQLLDHIIVFLRPMPVTSQTPTIDNIADEIDRLGFMVTKKIKKQFGLRGLGSAGAVLNTENRDGRPK